MLGWRTQLIHGICKFTPRFWVPGQGCPLIKLSGLHDCVRVCLCVCVCLQALFGKSIIKEPACSFFLRRSWEPHQISSQQHDHPSMIYFYLTHHPSLCSWETAGQAVKYPWSFRGNVDFVICAPTVLNSEKQAELAFAARALWLELCELPKDGSLVIWLALVQSGDFRVWKRALDPKDKTRTIWLSPIFCRPALESSMGFEETKSSASQNHGVAGFQKWCHFHISCEFCGCFPPSIHKWNPPTTRTPSVREIQRAEAQRGGAIGTRNTLLLTLKALVHPLIASLTLAAGSRNF